MIEHLGKFKIRMATSRADEKIIHAPITAEGVYSLHVWKDGTLVYKPVKDNEAHP